MDDDRVLAPEILEVLNALDRGLSAVKKQLELELASLAARVTRSTAIRRLAEGCPPPGKYVRERAHCRAISLHGHGLQGYLRAQEGRIAFELAQTERNALMPPPPHSVAR